MWRVYVQLKLEAKESEREQGVEWVFIIKEDVSAPGPKPSQRQVLESIKPCFKTH